MLTETFQKHFLEDRSRVSSEQVLRARKKAWDRFQRLELFQDDYQYLRLKPLFETSFEEEAFQTIVEVEKAILPECKNSCLVFVNGSFKKELSRTTALPKGLICASEDTALRSFGTYIMNQQNIALKEENEFFTLLNQARYQDALFLYVPPKMQVDTPVQIISVISSQKGQSIMPKIMLFQGAGSLLSLVHTLSVENEGSYFYNSLMEIQLEENAELNLMQSALSTGACHDEKSWIFESLRATVLCDARLKTVSLTDARAKTRRDFRVKLAGENAQAHLSGLAFLDGSKEAHMNVIIQHDAPHTESQQLFKNVLKDKARSSFQGKIHVKQIAQKTQAYQLNNNMLLSDEAEAHSKPNLEILADDVKASHGATVGELNFDEVFYLRSRGFSEAQAKGILIEGFCREVTDRMALQSEQLLANECIKEFVKRLSYE